MFYTIKISYITRIFIFALLTFLLDKVFLPLIAGLPLEEQMSALATLIFIPGAFSLSKEWTRVTLLAIKFIEV